MADGLRLVGRRYDPILGTTVAGEPFTEEEYIGLSLPPDSDIERGYLSGVSGTATGAMAGEALSAEIAGERAKYDQLQEEMRQEQAKRQLLAPRVQSLREIGGPGDTADWAQGAFGNALATMGPPIAGAVAGRALLGGAGRAFGMPMAGRAGAYAGGFIPAQQMEAGEAFETQYGDPEALKVDPVTRQRVGQAKGVVGGLLESVVPATLAAPGKIGAMARQQARRQIVNEIAAKRMTIAEGREALARLPKPTAHGFGETVGTAMGEEALTEAAQEKVGQIAHSFVNPQRDTSRDLEDIYNAAAMGAVGAGGISMPFAALHAGSEQAQKGIDLAKRGAADIKQRWDDRRAGTETEPEPGPEGPDPDDAAARSLVIGDEDPALESDDANTFGENLIRAGAERAIDAARIAQKLMSDVKVPQAIKDKLQTFKDYTIPEVQKFIGEQQLAKRAGTLAGAVVGKIEELWERIQPPTRKSRQTPPGGPTDPRDIETNYNQLLQAMVEGIEGDTGFPGLSASMRDNPEVMEGLRRVARIMSTGSVDLKNRSTREYLQSVVGLANLTTNPKRLFAKLAKALKDPTLETRVQRAVPAQIDAFDPESVLIRNLTPEARTEVLRNPEAAHALGMMVDMAISGSLGVPKDMAAREAKAMMRWFSTKGARQVLTPVTHGRGIDTQAALRELARMFGSEAALNDVMEYYHAYHEEKVDKEALTLQPEEQAELTIGDQEKINEADEAWFDLEEDDVSMSVSREPQATYYFMSEGAEAIPFASVTQARRSGRPGMVMTYNMMIDEQMWQEAKGAFIDEAIPASYIEDLTERIFSVKQEEAQRLLDYMAKRVADRKKQAGEVMERKAKWEAATDPVEKEKRFKSYEYARQLNTPSGKQETKDLETRHEILVGLPAEDVLQGFYIVRDDGTRAGTLIFTQADLKLAGTLKKARGRTKEENERAEKTRFEVMLGSKVMKLSAESLWKTWARKLSGTREPSRDESKDPLYAARMFMEGYAALAARSDFRGAVLEEGLLIDRVHNFTWADIQGGPLRTVTVQDGPKQGEEIQVRSGPPMLEDRNIPEARERFDEGFEDVPGTVRERGEGAIEMKGRMARMPRGMEKPVHLRGSLVGKAPAIRNKEGDDRWNRRYTQTKSGKARTVYSITDRMGNDYQIVFGKDKNPTLRIRSAAGVLEEPQVFEKVGQAMQAANQYAAFRGVQRAATHGVVEGKAEQSEADVAREIQAEEERPILGYDKEGKPILGEPSPAIVKPSDVREELLQRQDEPEFKGKRAGTVQAPAPIKGGKRGVFPMEQKESPAPGRYEKVETKVKTPVIRTPVTDAQINKLVTSLKGDEFPVTDQVLDKIPVEEGPEQVISGEKVEEKEKKKVKQIGWSHIVSFKGTKMLVVNMNGVRVPFYLNQDTGKWLAFFGVGNDGWINVGRGEKISPHYGSSLLKNIAEGLDKSIGDIRKQTIVEAIPQSFDVINTGFKPTTQKNKNAQPIVRAAMLKLKKQLAGAKKEREPTRTLEEVFPRQPKPKAKPLTKPTGKETKGPLPKPQTELAKRRKEAEGQAEAEAKVEAFNKRMKEEPLKKGSSVAKQLDRMADSIKDPDKRQQFLDEFEWMLDKLHKSMGEEAIILDREYYALMVAAHQKVMGTHGIIDDDALLNTFDVDPEDALEVWHSLLQAHDDSKELEDLHIARLKTLVIVNRMISGFGFVVMEPIETLKGGDSSTVGANLIHPLQHGTDALVLMIASAKKFRESSKQFDITTEQLITNTAYHEAAHVAITAIVATQGKEVAKKIVDMANQPHIIKQIVDILEKRGLSTLHYELNPEEAFTEAFALWMAGDLKLDVDKGDGILKRVFQFIKDLLAELSGDKALQSVFEHMKAGQLRTLLGRTATQQEMIRAHRDRAEDPNFILYHSKSVPYEQMAGIAKRLHVRYKPVMDELLKTMRETPKMSLRGSAVKSMIFDYFDLIDKGFPPASAATVAVNKIYNLDRTLKIEEAERKSMTPKSGDLIRIRRLTHLLKLTATGQKFITKVIDEVFEGDPFISSAIYFPVLHSVLLDTYMRTIRGEKPQSELEEAAYTVLSEFIQYPEKFEEPVPPGHARVSASRVLQDTPHAAHIIAVMNRMGMPLVGSLSLAMQGELYRAKDMQIHDLDFVTNDETTRERAVVETMRLFPGSIDIYSTHLPGGKHVLGMLIIPAGHVVQRTGNRGYDVININTGKVVGTMRRDMRGNEVAKGVRAIITDFFLSPPHSKITTMEIPIPVRGGTLKVITQPAGRTFNAKLSPELSRDKDINDFSRWTDQYMLFNKLSEDIHKELKKEGIPAAHETRSKFHGRFDWRRSALSGMGAMEKGAGTYLSTSEGVHQAYKKQFTAHLQRMLSIEGKDVEPSVLTAVSQAFDLDWANFLVPGKVITKADRDDMKSKIEKRLREKVEEKFKTDAAMKVGPAHERTDAHIKHAIASQKVNILARSASLIEKLPLGKVDFAKRSMTYHVTVRAKPDEILNYDADIKQQPEKIQKALKDWVASSNNTGWDIYQRMRIALGGDVMASEHLSSQGIAGASYASAGGEDPAYPNYVIYDDSKIDTNFVQFSKERTDDTVLTEEQQQEVLAELVRLRGPDVALKWMDFMGDNISGTYEEQGRIIRLALSIGTNRINVIRHEALHDLFAMVRKSGDKNQKQAWNDVQRALNAPYVKGQLKKLLANEPSAWADALQDPEEMAAYAYQFWAEGQIEVGPKLQDWFSKLMKFIRDVLGILSLEEKADALLLNFHEGKFAKPSTAAEVLADLKLETLKDKARRIAPPIVEVMEKMMQSAPDRLHSYGIKALSQIANLFHKPAEYEHIKDDHNMGFLDAAQQQRAIWLNKMVGIIRNADKETLTEAREALQSGRQATGRAGAMQAEVHQMLDDLFKYLEKAGVKRYADVDPETKQINWEPLRYVKNYFPRSWVPAKIRADREGFINLLVTEGKMSKQKATRLYDHFSSLGDGQSELAETDHHLGYTPYAPSVQERTLDFITRENVGKFTPYFDSDLIHILSAYITHATHRAEYARRFDNGGERIEAMLGEALKQGATPEQLADSRKAIRAMEGTLNYNFSGRAREFFNAMLTYQNIVLLPFSLFNSLVDPMGVALRTGNWGDAWDALLEGFKGIGQALTGSEHLDANRQMAMDLGIIDNQLALGILGDVYSGPFMSRWLRTVNEKFFRWNGMSIWNERMRISAMLAGERFIIHHARVVTSRGDKALGAPDVPDYSDKEIERSERYLEELGIKPSDVKLLNNKLAMDVDDLSAAIAAMLGGPINENTDKEAEAASRRIKDGLYKFVDSAVLRPSSAHRPVWGSDPRWLLIFHLKQFAFSFQNVIIRRAQHEAANGNVRPYYMLASYVPFVTGTSTLKMALLGTLPPDFGPLQAINNGIAQSGLLGINIFGHEAVMDAAAGGVPGQSFAGPTAGHAIKAAQTVAGARMSSWSGLMDRSVPFLKYAH